MPKIHYSQVIEEDPQELKELERYHRYTHLFQRVRMLRLLKSRVSERGRQELVTPEAFEELQEAMKRGQIATISEADQFLRERHGIEYAHPDGVGQLLRRRKVKLKTGRPRHEEADPEEQEAFKKTSRTPSAEAESAIVGSR